MSVPPSPPEQSPGQAPFRIDVEALPADVLGYLSWQFSELVEYGREGDRHLAVLEAARNKFDEDMRSLAEHDPDRVAAAYESIANHVDPVYRRYAPECAERYAAVRPERIYSFLDTLLDDGDVGVHNAAVDVVTRPFISSEGWYNERIVALKLTPREIGALLYKAYLRDRHRRAAGSVGLASTVEQPRE